MRFTDEFAEIPIDASGAVWFATANDAARIPEPLLNRMNVYEIEAPDASGSARIANSLYREIRESHDWGKRFPESPSGSVVEKLALLTPREMRRAVQAAFGSAKVAGRDELQPEDIDVVRGSRKSRIGF
jgi:ATP-dependent Lon protease